LFFRDGSGTAIQMTITGTVNSGAGSIAGMSGTDAGASYTDGSKTFNFFTDSANVDYGKMAHADLLLYKFSDDNSADTDYVTIAANAGVSGASGTIYVPSENGTFLTTNTSYATAAINIATSASNYPINLKPNGTGHVVVGNGSATGKLTSNGAFDLILSTNSGTNSGTIVITDAADGNIDITPNGTGEVNLSKVDIDAGAIDGTAIGASSHTTGKFTTCDATTDFTIGGLVITDGQIADTGILVIAATTATSFSDGNITHVGDLNCDSISVDDAAVGLDVIFGGNTTLNKLSLTDNLADALNINQGGTSYLQFVTTNSGEKIVAGKDLETLTTTKIKQKGSFMQSSFHQSLTLGY